MHRERPKLGYTVSVNKMSAGWAEGMWCTHKENKCDVSPVSLSRCSPKLCTVSCRHAVLPLIHGHNSVHQTSLQSSTALSQEISKGFFFAYATALLSFPMLGGRVGGRRSGFLPVRAPAPWACHGTAGNIQGHDAICRGGFSCSLAKQRLIMALPLFVVHNRAHDLLSSTGSPRCYVLYCCDDKSGAVHRTGSPAALSSVNHRPWVPVRHKSLMA